MKKTKKDPNAPESLLLSVSSVETFMGCKAKRYYRYIEKLPAPHTYHTTAGSFIHKILEIFIKKYSKNKDLRLAGNTAFFLAKKDEDLAPTLTPEIIEEGKQWLKFIVKRYEKSPELIPNTLKVEAPFNFKIDESLSVRGFIDRIDQVDPNTIRIVDYKTSSNPSYLSSFQLATYTIATQKKYPGKVIQASYELIRHEFENKAYDISEAELQNVIQTFTKAADEIRHLKKTSPTEAWDPTPTRLCSYCPFRIRCETDRAKKSPAWKV